MLRKIATLSLAVATFAACGETPTGGAPAADLPPPAPPSRHVVGETPGNGTHPELAVTITAPEAGAIVPPGSVLLSWEERGSAQNYRYRLDCTGDGCTPVDTIVRPASQSTSLTLDLTPGTYTFYIRGERTTGQGEGEQHGAAYSTRTFHVAAPPPTKQGQSITWKPVADGTYGDVFEIASLVSASSGLPVTLASVTPSTCVLGPIDTPHTDAGHVRLVGAGTCTIRATQAGSDDFFPADDADASFSVDPKALVVTAVASPATKVYDGQGFDESTFSASYDGFVDGDDAGVLEGTLSFEVRTPPAASFTYPDAGGYELHVSGVGSPNYDVSFRSTPVTIERATPTIDFTVGGPYTYDGTARTATGVVRGVGGVELGAAVIAYDGSSDAPVNAGDYTVTGHYAGSANYLSVTLGAEQKLTIHKAPLTVTARDEEKVFDGQPFAGPFAVRYDGFVNDEGPDVLTGTLVFSGPGVTATAVGEHAVVPGGLSARNYDLSFVPGTLTIHAWTLTGFYQPVKMGTPGSPVYNTVKGGSTVPLKFEIFAARQAGIDERTDVAAVRGFAMTRIACDANANALEAEVLITTTGGTSLRYDLADGQFVQNWQTPRTAGACYRVSMTAADGSTIEAFFRLK